MDASEVLPNELWLHTLSYLSNTDLKALRLSMEPHLRSLASSLLFTTAYIAARKDVLDTFTNLTTHPVFRAYVKEIVFDSSWIDPGKVAEHADDKDGPALAGLFQEQEGIQANELQIRLENASQCLRCQDILSDYASTTLQQLSLGSRVHACTDGGIPHWFLLPNTNIDTSNCFPDIFYGLRKFELSVSIFDHVEVLSSITSSTQLHFEHFKEEGIATILGLAKSLEEIKLTGDPSDARLCITNTLAKCKRARLRVLDLRRFEVSASGLEDFLNIHTLSLQRMTLYDFHLTSGSWRDLGAIVPIITPALEFILGFVTTQNGRFNIDKFLPVSSSDLEILGIYHGWYHEAKGDDDAEFHVEDEDEDESEDGRISEDLEYSSDDSSPETEEEPRRNQTLTCSN